jgi:glycerophosphoryl diester phosphodiesterase
VVIHDFTLERTGPAARAGHPLGDPRADAGQWREAVPRPEVPLLEEVFASRRRLYFDVELKWELRSRRRAGAESRAGHPAPRPRARCLFPRSTPAPLRARRLAPELPARIRRHPELPFLLRHGAAAVLLPGPLAKPQGRRIRAWNAALFRLLGSRLVAWTVDEPEEARRLLDLGVGGLISNDPGRLAAAGLFERSLT